MEGLFPLQKELEKRIEWLKCEGGGGGEEFGCQKPVDKEQVTNCRRFSTVDFSVLRQILTRWRATWAKVRLKQELHNKRFLCDVPHTSSLLCLLIIGTDNSFGLGQLSSNYPQFSSPKSPKNWTASSQVGWHCCQPRLGSSRQQKRKARRAPNINLRYKTSKYQPQVWNIQISTSGIKHPNINLRYKTSKYQPQV